MTQLNKELLKKALGYSDDAHYQERINNGFDWCKNWLVKNQPYHGLDLNDEILGDLKEVIQESKATK
jgi:hypothetical protein